MLKRLLNSLSALCGVNTAKDLTAYWKARARKYGKHSVLNLAHGKEQFNALTEYQARLLFPLLESQLNGSENIVLDFGCGPGRFTGGLAELIDGSAVGVDIASELLMIAPKLPSVSYQLVGSSALPFEDAVFDVVWSCLVLGGIPDEAIERTMLEIERVLRPGGIFFFVENTANVKNTAYWFFRNEEIYCRLAAFCKPKVLGRYDDIGQQISIFCGRKI